MKRWGFLLLGLLGSMECFGVDGIDWATAPRRRPRLMRVDVTEHPYMCYLAGALVSAGTGVGEWYFGQQTKAVCAALQIAPARYTCEGVRFAGWCMAHALRYRLLRPFYLKFQAEEASNHQNLPFLVSPLSHLAARRYMMFHTKSQAHPIDTFTDGVVLSAQVMRIIKMVFTGAEEFQEWLEDKLPLFGGDFR